MSWQIFKNSILSVIKAGDALNSVDEMATLYAIAYDTAIKSNGAGDTVNKIKIKNGNLPLMIQLFKINFYTGQASMVPYDWVGGMKPGILAYWQGAALQTSPIPIIPAIGSVVNIKIVSGIVTTPGDWQPGSPLPPNNNPNLIIDAFIVNAIAHLQTVSGIINTISLYPPLATPGPGIVNWSGYFVLPSSPGVSIMADEPSTEALLETIPDDNNTLEGAKEVVAETGAEILTDGGEDGGEQLESLKDELPPDNPPYEEVPEEEVDDVTTNEETTEEEPTPTNCNFGSINYNMNLSPNYRLRDLSIGCVFAHKIKAQVGLSEKDIICNLRNIAVNILEPLRQRYPNIRINSAFRGTASIPGGVSQHQKGEAIDIQIPGASPKEYAPLANWIRTNLPFDQLIFEHGNSVWLHISCKKSSGQRKQLLTMYKGRYSSGLKLYYV